MKSSPLSRRSVIAGAGAFASTAFAGAPAVVRAAPTKVRLLTTWFAQAEHGGFYQAKATGLYEKAGLDVSIAQGGPQVNGLQLLTGGDTDVAMGYDIQVLSAVEKGLPVTTVAASFQFDLQGIMAHADVPALGALKGHKVLIASTSYATFWPWLKERYGFTDDQAAPYTFNLQPFFADPAVAQQAYVTSETFQAQKANVPIKFFLLADGGYPPYSSTMVTTRPYLDKNPDVVARLVRASMEGWRSYLRDPAPANALIKADNPKETDEQIAFSVDKLRTLKALTTGDAATMGIGTMTEARWKRTRDFLVRNSLLKESTDWKSAFTTRFVTSMKVMG